MPHIDFIRIRTRDFNAIVRIKAYIVMKKAERIVRLFLFMGID